MKKIHIILNGQKYYLDKYISLMDLITYLNYNQRLVVIEYNRLICPSKTWAKIVLKKNDKIEIITIVGGG